MTAAGVSAEARVGMSAVRVAAEGRAA